jgi:D-beta-D-heptose 7-phosphate kinase / D-beta-D-heptose 1-phosphate adenosyltransferase
VSDFLKRQFERRARVAVFGDAMIDEYYEVEADRVSPEFPIPVMLSESGRPSEVVPGGAGNVHRQFSNFNFDVDLFAVADERFRACFGDARLRTLDSPLCSVPVKTRFYNGSFPLCRLDSERAGYGLSSSALKEAQSGLLSALLESDPYEVVVFSDYDKGVFQGVEPFIHRLPESTITIVDPKRHPIERWRGCTIIKPNSSEARFLSGSDDWVRQCEYFMARTGCQAVVITQAGDGVVGNVMGSLFEYRPPSSVNPRSVIGAGDAFVAFLAMCMAHAIDIREAVEIAFRACSSYVGKTRNSPIYPYELELGKFVMPESLASRDFGLSFSNGCFDILHPGHVEMLEFARGRAERLAVALNSDASVLRQKKSHPPVNDLSHRMGMVAALDCVDFVLSFDEDTPYELMKRVMPDVLVKGSDWPNPVGSDLVREVCSFALVGGHSTTGMIEKIRGLTH